MQTKEIKQLAIALAKAQGEISVAHKDTRNAFYNSSYADLASCWDACRAALTKNELSVAQYPGNSEPGWLNLITLLLHSSGQWIKGSIRMKLQTRKSGVGWVDATGRSIKKLQSDMLYMKNNGYLNGTPPKEDKDEFMRKVMQDVADRDRREGKGIMAEVECGGNIAPDENVF